MRPQEALHVHGATTAAATLLHSHDETGDARKKKHKTEENRMS